MKAKMKRRNFAGLMRRSIAVQPEEQTARRPDGRVVVITGGATGLGRPSAEGSRTQRGHYLWRAFEPQLVGIVEDSRVCALLPQGDCARRQMLQMVQRCRSANCSKPPSTPSGWFRLPNNAGLVSETSFLVPTGHVKKLSLDTEGQLDWEATSKVNVWYYQGHRLVCRSDARSRAMDTS